jgi:MoaA/NifB/PqqE/SkfB family radical SAM enzyme
MQVKNAINWMKTYVLIKFGFTTPPNLVVFISGRCNLFCKHCFWWNMPHDEMTLRQYELISRSIKGRLDTFHVTGGEPMLRDDIGEICALFAKNNRMKNIVISSNCTLDDMPGRCKMILDKCKEAGHEPHLSLLTSLDGMEKFHDWFRGKKGAFKATVRQVKALKRAGIDVGVCATLTNENKKEIFKISKFAREILGVPFSFDIVRGKPRDESIKPPKFDGRYLDIETPFYPKSQQWRTKVKFDVLSGKGKFKCLAGNFSGVIYSNGDVSICELQPPFGNLNETNYDFAELWKRRPKVPAGCSCTQGINITSSMYYSTRTMMDVLKKNIKLKIVSIYRILLAFGTNK